MDKTEIYRDLAKKDNLKFNEEDQRHHCLICEQFYGKNKSYVRESQALSHMDEHISNVRMIESFIKVKINHINKSIEYNRESILKVFQDNQRHWDNDSEQFFERLKTDSIENALSWMAEGIVKSEQKYSIVRKIEKYFYEDLKVPESWSEDKLIEFYNAVTDEERRIKDRLIDRPYRHSSTSLMSNAVDEWKTYANAEMVNGHSFNGLRYLIHYTDSLIEKMRELSDVEKKNVKKIGKEIANAE